MLFGTYSFLYKKYNCVRLFRKSSKLSVVWSKEYCPPAFLGENKARERVNTVCISRERNEVLVKNAEQDHGLYYSRLVYDNKKPSLSDGFFALRGL